MKIITVTLAVFILFYLGGAFAFADFNISKWDANIRQKLAFILIFTVFYVLTSHVLTKYLTGK